jgi:hypothetical protein
MCFYKKQSLKAPKEVLVPRIQISIALATLILIACAGCTGDPPSSSVVQTSEEEVKVVSSKGAINLSASTTMGNHTWVPINMPGGLDENHPVVLKVLQRFEEEHPELEVYDVDVHFQQYAHRVSHCVLGIWIHHRPRK